MLTKAAKLAITGSGTLVRRSPVHGGTAAEHSLNLTSCRPDTPAVVQVGGAAELFKAIERL